MTDAVRPIVLHPRDLAGCEHRLALDMAVPEPAGGSVAGASERLPDTPEAARRKQAAADHRDRVREFLRGIHSDQGPRTWLVVDPDRPRRERVDQTLAACADGVGWIWGAALPTDRAAGRRGDSELLVRVGNGHVPVIVVNHRVSYPASPNRPNGAGSTSTSPLWAWAPQRDPARNGRNQRRDQLRLAQLMTMLIDLGLAPTEDDGVVDPEKLMAGAIGLDADCIVTYDMGPILADYAEVFERRQRVARGEVPTQPRRVGECRGCPWWERCEPELVVRRDVSLVVNGGQYATLAEIGITTIDELAEYRGPQPPEWPGNVRFSDAVVSAIAWRSDTPLIRRVDEPYVRRADVEVDVDMESYGERGAYMWGTLLTDNVADARPVIYRSFVTWTPLPTDDEARSFAQFWTWLMSEREAAHADGKTFAAYCYSQQAENRWLLGSADRFVGMPGIPTRAEVEAFIGSDEWVDVFEAVGRNFISPKGKGLKRVAPVAGHAWRDANASGEASMDWYRDAVALDGGEPDLTQRARLLEYNEDDVRATKVLREWITASAREDVPHEDELLERADTPD